MILNETARGDCWGVSTNENGIILVVSASNNGNRILLSAREAEWVVEALSEQLEKLREGQILLGESN